MLDGKGGFVLLPAEKIIHKSAPRIGLAITTPTTYPGNDPLAIHCSSGTVYLTNHRVRPDPEQKLTCKAPLTEESDCIPSRESHSRTAVLLSSTSQPSRYPSHRSLVWSKCMAGISATRARRQHPCHASCHRIEVDF